MNIQMFIASGECPLIMLLCPVVINHPIGGVPCVGSYSNARRAVD